MQTLGVVLDELYTVLQARKAADADRSYVASLYARGLDGILQKIGEEATETIVAAKNANPPALVYELADLWFHTLVLMAQQDITPQQLAAELARRGGRSGLDEKAARPR